MDAPPKAETSSLPIVSPLPKERSPTQNLKGKGFRIGGKAKKSESPAPLPEEAQEIPSTERGEDAAPIPSRPKADSEAPTGTKTARKGFKIGGKGKAPVENKDAGLASSSPRKSRNVSAAVQSPLVEPTTVSTRAKKEATPIEDDREETAEEKAERKRRELKRKNEEAAKKQAQSKKKKRF